MADRPEMFGPTRGFLGDGRINGTVQNVVGPTLVAMAMKFGLGAGIQSPTGLFVLSVSNTLPVVWKEWLGTRNSRLDFWNDLDYDTLKLQKI